MHAEHLSYLKLTKTHCINKRTGYDLMVLRLTKAGTLGYSRPCKECLMRLKKSKININNVYYSMDDKTIGIEKFNSMADSSLTKSSGGTIRNHKNQ